ncbi:MAG: radical SAM protein [Actinobacteria bacterium]|nr:radical SAM protein [Actinomycetota bacterium]MBI3686794.1 radical SAM protein [Actinomycetota bacterium]
MEITGKCQLECAHCYAESGPAGTHGVMTTTDWRRVVDQAAGMGVGMVQFIGGEPTLHPDLAALVDHALVLGLRVEVFTNLTHVTPALWEVFARPGVRLATSYYSDAAAEHERVTVRRGSHARTRANIVEAVRRSVPLRVGVIDFGDGQRVDAAISELAALGAIEVGVDHLRRVGRGVREVRTSASQLCGRCGDGVLAVAPDGTVWPCVFSRWLPLGNVREDPVAEIATGEAAERTRTTLAGVFVARHPQPPEAPCVPRMCNPQCGPSCGPACNPSCWPTGAGPCAPKGGCVPNYRR